MTYFVTTFPLPLISREKAAARGFASPTPTPGDVVTFSVAVDEAARVVATAFGETPLLERRAQLGHWTKDSRRTAIAREQISAFCAGELRAFSLPLAPKGSVFQHRVWTALQGIPYGETRSYGDLARQLGSAPRAVGRANATNPICLVIPCHRVIGADGSLTGFAFGEELKRQLLAHEASHRESSPARSLATTAFSNACLAPEISNLKSQN